MRVVVVGLGIQGQKRAKVAGVFNVVGVVDPNVHQHNYPRWPHVNMIPTDSYDAVLLCVPNDQKIALIKDCLANNKHVLVEKPLLGAVAEIDDIEAEALARGLVVYTAYNHRFEPALIEMRRAIEAERIGPLYAARMFYGNGTAALVKRSPWRDTGDGVIPEIGAHLIDLTDFLFRPKIWLLGSSNGERYETATPDYATWAFVDPRPHVEMTVTYLSWKNEFRVDVYGQNGSLHVDGLCKWGPSTFAVRNRVLPAGVPFERSTTFVQPDPTWAFEYEHFKALIAVGKPTSLTHDRWIATKLSQIGGRV